MPHDLFGDVAGRPPAVRSPRSPLVLLSVCLHGGILVFAIVASVVAPDVLPFPRQVLAFHEPVDVKLVDIDLPSPPRRVAARPQSTDAASLNRAPVVAPTGISQETGFEGLLTPPPGDVSGSVDAIGPVGVVSGPPPPPPPPVPVPPVPLHSGIRAPVKVVDIAPIYPTLARQTHVQGLVIIEATLDVGGSVQSARVLRGHPLLDEAALDAVRQWRYEPAQLNGQPVAVIMTITVRFTLQ